MISQNKILDIIKKGLKYRKNYMMFTTNKGVNFNANMSERLLGIYININCNRMIVISSKVWFFSSKVLSSKV